MPDVYLNIAEQPEEVIGRIAAAMDARASDTVMHEITQDYLADLPRGARRVVEVGCGSGSATVGIREALDPQEYVGVEPSEGLIARARDRFAEMEGVTLAEGAAEATGLPDACADIVLFHTVFSHLADPASALLEAARILRPGGHLAIFDGDYAANTVALSPADPLQCAMQMAERHLIHGPYVMRTLPGLLPGAGLNMTRVKGHGYVCTGDAPYVRSLIERGLALAEAAGELSPDLATSLLAEADARMADGSFFGSIMFVSIVAERL